MTLRARLFALWTKKRPKSLSAMKIIAIVFAAIILLGAALLTLPAASRSGVSCGFRPALFTATSATCVTGLSLYDTFTQWSGFGQTVIICLIQIGGLGFMSAATLFVFLLHKRIGLKQRLVMAQALSVSDMDGIVKLQKTVLKGSFLVEGIGAAILFVRFLPEFGFVKALTWGLFHAISAFCNAGFDIFGCITPGASLMEFQSDPVVLLTLGALVVIGGLGFLVWQDVSENRVFRKCSVYTRLVLLTTAGLILLGWFMICLLEWNNAGTLGDLSTPDKLLNGLFQSVTLRTAGFASVDQALLSESGKAVSIVLMLIGGSPGSTAGGMKTTTLAVMLSTAVSVFRRREHTHFFGRRINDDTVRNAATVFMMYLVLFLIGGFVISRLEGLPLLTCLYETASAIGTVGLTLGITPDLGIVSQIILIFLMYIGRVGGLTLIFATLSANKNTLSRLPLEKITVG